MTKNNAQIGMDKWLEVGLDLLGQRGPNSLTIDTLCEAIGRSKGSFYFHFKSVEGYRAALLEHWEAMYTDLLEVEMIKLPNDLARRRALPRLTSAVDGSVEQAIRVWSFLDPAVLRTIEAVDNRRISYVASLIQSVEGVSADDAFDLATIEYAASLALPQIHRNLTTDQTRRYFERTLRLITPNVGPPGDDS